MGSTKKAVLYAFCPCWAGDAAQLVERRTGISLTQVRFPGAEWDFSASVYFQCKLSYGVCAPPCAIAYLNSSAHVKDRVVHVRVWWIMEILPRREAGDV